MREGERKQERRGGEEKEGKKSGVSCCLQNTRVGEKRGLKKEWGKSAPIPCSKLPSGYLTAFYSLFLLSKLIEVLSLIFGFLENKVSKQPYK